MINYKKAVVYGGGGLIGSKVVDLLRKTGIDVVPASRRTHVNIFTGEGLEAALKGADLTIDVSDVPSLDEQTLKTFFRTSGDHIFKAERDAGVRHHVLLSIVGVNVIHGNPYYEAKRVQEKILFSSGVPYTLVRATQFFEFMPMLAAAYSKDGIARFPDAMFQPASADDVAAFLAQSALGRPTNDAVFVAGPERSSFADTFARFFELSNDARRAVTDASSTFFGANLGSTSIVPEHVDHWGTIRLADWVGSAAGNAAFASEKYANHTPV